MRIPKTTSRTGRRLGFTLIEVAIALAVVALGATLTIMGVNAVTHASLRSTALDLAGAVKYAYDRSIMEKRTQRLAIDLDKGLWWLEYTDDRFALQKGRTQGTEGKDREAEDDDSASFFEEKVHSEVKNAMEGSKGTSFSPDEEAGKPTPLPSGIHFSRVWTPQREDAALSGTEYIHFFRMGWTEAAFIEITDGDPKEPLAENEYITLKLSPLTGRIRTKHERFEVPSIRDDDGRAEGDE